MKLETAAWVVIADGQKHLILENRGDPDLIDLRVRNADNIKLSSNKAAGADRPGRFEIGGSQHTSVEHTDWKRLDKEHFSKQLADEINAAAEAGEMKHFVLVADPRTISTVRGHLSRRASDGLVHEIVGDFTKQTIGQIEDLIVSA
jgi:protein required for attachment to host cells